LSAQEFAHARHIIVPLFMLTHRKPQKKRRSADMSLRHASTRAICRREARLSPAAYYRHAAAATSRRATT